MHRAVLRGVYVRLSVLDTHAHGKGLGLHRHAKPFEHLKGVPRRVAYGEDKPVAINCIFFSRLRDLNAAEDIFIRNEPRELCSKAHLAAEPDDGFPYALHDVYENIRADMGLCVIEYALRRAVAHELFEHPADALVPDAGVQLAVGKGTRSALAELHVALGVESAARAEGLHRFPAAFRVLPALEDDGPQPRLGQHKCGKHSGRAEARDHGALIRAQARDIIVKFLKAAHIFAFCPRKELILAVNLDRDGIKPVYIVFLSGVQRLFGDGEPSDISFGNMQLTSCFFPEFFLALACLKAQGTDQYHLPSLPAT